ncbi:MAG: histidine kinase [Gallionella sp.]|nr:histidine kinase [Gallionella sp.]
MRTLRPIRSVLQNCTLALIGLLLSFPLMAEELRLAEAQYVMVASDEPPQDDANWQTVTLPDQWKLSRPGQGGDVWYRLHFKLVATPKDSQALYLPRLCMNASAYLNGVFLGDGGSFTDPVGRNWNRPLLFLAPPSLFRTGQNTLYVRLNSPSFSLGALSPIYLGDARTLTERYDTAFFMRITLNQAATLIIAAMGLFMLALWSRRRQDSMYGYFGLSSLIWSFNSSNLFLRTIPIPAQLWETLINASFQIFISLLMIALLRFLGLRKPLLEKALWAILIGSPLSLILLPGSILISVSMFWHLLTLLSSLTVSVLVLREAIRRPHLDSLLLVSALGVNLMFGIHDWLKHASSLYGDDPHWIHYGAPVFFLVVGGIMTNRFVQALNQFEQLNADLEQRVQHKHTELENQYSSMQAMEKQRTMLEERERIYRDLHDDVGAKLLGLAISAQRANLPKEADLARSALQDLRDVVSRSTQEQTPLSDLLADWRIETEQRVQAAELTLHWQFPDYPADITLSSQSALHMSRIVREAVTNVLRHAQASQISVHTRLEEERFYIDIEDDGLGFDPETARSHRGMASMRARATTLQGTLDWLVLLPHGCRVSLCVPLSALTTP